MYRGLRRLALFLTVQSGLLGAAANGHISFGGGDVVMVPLFQIEHYRSYRGNAVFSPARRPESELRRNLADPLISQVRAVNYPG
jgi:hypothetical protein